MRGRVAQVCRESWKSLPGPRSRRRCAHRGLLETAAEVFKGAFEFRDLLLQDRDALAIGRAAIRRRDLCLFRDLDIAGKQLRPALFLVACLPGQFLDESDVRQPV